MHSWVELAIALSGRPWDVGLEGNDSKDESRQVVLLVGGDACLVTSEPPSGF